MFISIVHTKNEYKVELNSVKEQILTLYGSAFPTSVGDILTSERTQIELDEENASRLAMRSKLEAWKECVSEKLQLIIKGGIEKLHIMSKDYQTMRIKGKVSSELNTQEIKRMPKSESRPTKKFISF